MTLADDSPLDWTVEKSFPARATTSSETTRSNGARTSRISPRPKTAAHSNSLGVSIYDNGENLEYDLRLPPAWTLARFVCASRAPKKNVSQANGDLLLTLGRNIVTIGRPAIFEDSIRDSPHRACAPAKSLRRFRARSGWFGWDSRRSARPARAACWSIPPFRSSYATFLGGSGTDTAASVAVDSSGKVYVAGTTTSASSFPEAPSKSIGAADGPAEFFIAKMDPDHDRPELAGLSHFFGRHRHSDRRTSSR